MVPNPPLSASASKPISLGWRQLNNYWSPFWTANSFDVDAEPHVENHASA